MQRATEIDRAIIGETARWGAGNTRQTWLNAQAAVRSWFPQRTGILLNQLRNAGLYSLLNPPAFAPFGGLVPPGYSLALSNANAGGAIYFTLNGPDPRLWGGALSGAAQLYSAPLTLTNAVTLRARVKDGANWSALVTATFYIVQDFRALAVTEIMYHPPAFALTNGDEVEFLELKNTGTNALDLSGLQFTDGLTFAFTNGTILASGAFFVLARNPAAFAAKYPGVTVNGVYSGKLDNGGEKLALAHVLGTNVFSFAFDTRPPWPITPDGYGFSLVRVNAAGDPDAPASWRPSAAPGGSPGADDPAVSIPPVLINEILTHTDPPQPDSIELFNPTAAAVDLSGWFLSDDGSTPKKFRVPAGTVIAAGGFLVFTETDFNPLPGVPPGFALSSTGESLFLFSGDATTNLTGYSHSFSYGASASGVPFGRYLLSTGEEQWPALSALTPGATNAAALVGPVVINEILYHPEAGYDEFVELKNVTGTNVALFDPAFPANAWRVSGLDFTFPSNTLIEAGGFLLLVEIDPALFRAKYAVPMNVAILGPFTGKLQDSGERLQLERPGAPIIATNGAVTVPYIVVDEVRYNDKPPWPPAADGDGPSLQRRVATAYGNEPTNWFASGFTAGADNVFNLAPTVTILSPTNGAGFDAPASFAVSVLAGDADGTVTKIEFYRDGSKLGETTNSTFAFSVANLGAGTYTFTAKARDNGLATASASVTVVVNPPPVGTGTGLFGEYYDDLGFAGTKLTRLDPTVNFHWGGGSPDPAMGADQFSVRWTGQVQPRLTAPYTFYTVSDDGVRLWVNNLLLIDNWTDHGDTENRGSISLVAGTRYDIRMEMYENGGGATATLAWSTPDLPQEIIPATQLYSLRRPTILAQPQNQAVPAGSNVTFRVTADGTSPLGSQWYFNGVAIPGANATNLPLNNVQTANVGNYFVVITNSEGSVTSLIAALVLLEPLAFTQQPQSQTCVVGDTVTLSVAVSGTAPISYRWRKNGLTYVPLGVATATLTMTNVQLTNAGNYTVVITNISSLGLLSATAVLTVLADTDGDHIPDVWEIANGFNTNSAADANLDTDGDGMTNLQEYIAGTNPRDASSYLKVDRISMSSGATLSFAAVSNRSYTVQFRDSAGAGAWLRLTNLVSAPTNRTVTVIDGAGGPAPSRYYRLATPALP
jgi:hypothetical protein